MSQLNGCDHACCDRIGDHEHFVPARLCEKRNCVVRTAVLRDAALLGLDPDDPAIVSTVEGITNNVSSNREPI